MAAAIIKLDTLTDPVRPATQNGHFLAVGGLGLVGRRTRKKRRIGRIHIGGGRGKLRRAGVNPLENRTHAEVQPALAHISLVPLAQHGETAIRKAHALQAVQRAGCFRNAQLPHLLFRVDQILDLLQKPAIDLARFVNFLDRES